MYDYHMEKMIYQMFILGIGEKIEHALKNGLGGVIFFTKDIQTEEQFIELIKRTKNVAAIPPFLSIDQEGGRVERTENIHPKRLSAKYALKEGKDYLIKQTNEMADELQFYGINLNFAPCADVNTNPKNPIIGERSFSNDTSIVSECVKIVSDIYREHLIIPCIKHYPGHGDADKDSHLDLPEINLPIEIMKKFHIKPFADNINTEMIMAAHLYCTCFDKENIPASLSKNAIGYLRNELNYNGVIITDDMVMKGVSKYGPLEACLMAVNAGVDMFIFRNADIDTINIIEEFIKYAKNDTSIRQKIIASNQRISKLKQSFNIL